jgi:hypothetical protein
MGGWDSFTKSVTSTTNSAGNALSSTANTVGSGITGSSDSTVDQSVGGATLGVLTLAPVTATAAITNTGSTITNTETTPLTATDEAGWNTYVYNSDNLVENNNGLSAQDLERETEVTNTVNNTNKYMEPLDNTKATNPEANVQEYGKPVNVENIVPNQDAADSTGDEEG